MLDLDVPGAELSLLVAEPDWVTKLDTAWIVFWSPGYALRANAERVSPWAADAQSRRRLPVRMELVLTSLSPGATPSYVSRERADPGERGALAVTARRGLRA